MNTGQWIDLWKWVVVAVGAVVSFWVVDVGKLRLEEFRSKAENKRALLQAYLTATESVQPDVWKRKLRVLQTLSDDEPIRRWAAEQLRYIENFAAQDALYRETLAVASQLAYRTDPKVRDTKRESARARFEQLYWADLPFARETPAVEGKMVQFREALVRAESAGAKPEDWLELDSRLLDLAAALREEVGKLKP